MAEMTYQQRSNQSTRMAVNQQHSSGRVLQDNRAAFKQSTQLKTEQLAQRLTDEEELQGNQTAQRVKEEEDETLQEKSASVAPVQREEQTSKPNNTGLPDNLKLGIENLSGMSMDGVKVHYNSAKPAQLNALAYAQGQDIHVATGQEQHLPHEAWHVVQQAQGRVKPTMQMKGGVPVNDDKVLEREADMMGGRALQRAQKAVPDSKIIDNAQKNRSEKYGFELMDDRTEAVTQRTFQEITNIGTSESKAVVQRATFQLTQSQARDVRAGKQAAIKSLKGVIDQLHDGSAADLARTYLAVSTQRQLDIQAQRYEQILNFLLSFNGFMYDDDNDGAFGWTSYQNPHIYLQNAYFTSELYGADSMSGIIIHEATHNVLNTDDHAYGNVAAIALARAENKQKAKDNADNMEFLIEQQY